MKKLAFVFLVITTAGCDTPDVTAPQDADSAAASLSQNVDWSSHGLTADEQRHSPLAQINDANVGGLGLAWSYDTGQFRGHEATPLVKDGVMYVTASWSVVHALDARTGELLWVFDPEVPKELGRYACCGVVNRGVALTEDSVIFGTLHGWLIKLDAATGEVVWRVDTTNREVHYTITGAPRIVKDKVIIGNGGAEYGVRGYVSAYDIATGELDWRFFTVPGDPSLPFEHPEMEVAAKTWNGEWWHVGGGGTAWDAIVYDAELNLLYVGTGNGSPWSRTLRSPGGGDNLYLSSILALNPDDGRLVWHYQTTPGDNWDYTATQHIMLADLEIDGRLRKVAMQAPKNGFFYILDRATGELLSAEKFGTATWASHVDMATGRPVELLSAQYDDEPKIIQPGPSGVHNWEPMSYHPGTGLVYIPAHDTAGVYALAKDFTYKPGTFNVGMDRSSEVQSLRDQEPPRYPYLLAWDPIAQQERWRVDTNGGGILSTSGNLLFQGNADGELVAYAADEGERLWAATTNVGIIAPPVTYLLNGEQFVTVVSGSKFQPVDLSHFVNHGRVYTFKLGAALPMPDVAEKGDPNTPIPERFGTPEQFNAGNELYHNHCARCHGANAISDGVIRDLRFSPPGVHETWEGIVLDGAFAQLGMAGFGDILTSEEAQNIRSYVVAQANRSRAR